MKSHGYTVLVGAYQGRSVLGIFRFYPSLDMVSGVGDGTKINVIAPNEACTFQHIL